MRRLALDIETYCPLDLAKVGVYRYVEHPEFQVLMAAWSFYDEPTNISIGQVAIIQAIGEALLDENVVKVAHNATFERVCLSKALGLPVGEYLPASCWDDTMARAGVHGYPQSLDHLAKALEVQEKESAGKALIRTFCQPNRKGERVMPEVKPEQWLDFLEYCIQDVDTLKAADQILELMPMNEARVWLADQRINDYGVLADIELATLAVAASDENVEAAMAESRILTGLENPNSGQQMIKWLNEGGVAVDNLQAATVTSLLASHLLDPEQRRALELRQELALIAARKFTAALSVANSDDRLRGSFRYFGAHTGRWAGRGIQLHNLPRASMASPAEAEAAIVDLRLGGGASPQTLKELVRPLLLGPMTVVDFAAIEARVIAWLSGEEWALEAFYAGRDIYVETAERMGGLTRSQGKVAVLALGYAGGVGSLEAMGAEGQVEELQALVTQWRKANRRIVGFWSQLDTAFRKGGKAGRVHVEVEGATRRIMLPSGRPLTYRGVTSGQRLQFRDPRRNGLLTDTYGGRLAENVTQAVARDVLAEALVRLHERGLNVLGHVHDEVLVEGAHSVQAILDIVCTSPPWADGLPLSGEGFVCQRYQKG